MITYRLRCKNEHEFEGWFQSSTAFDTQASSGAIGCPSCGDTKISKAPMAPSVQGAKKKDKVEAAPDPAAVRKFMAGYRKFVEENADYVGKDFPEEARKIHYGETDERHIYGEATLSEVKELVDEGVAVAPVPPAPDDLN